MSPRCNPFSVLLHLRIPLAVLISAIALPDNVRAAVVIAGNVFPADTTTWGSSTNAYIGHTSVGSLALDGGSIVQIRSGTIGNESGSDGSATVSGDGSKWGMTSSLSVGFSGTAALSILDGGLVWSEYGTIGNQSDSEGTATVNGLGSRWEMSAGFYVGYDGMGTLNIEDDGWVAVEKGTHVNHAGNGSKIVFNEGTLQTKCIWAADDDLQGVGTIKANGWVLDSDVTVNTDTLIHSFAIADPASGKNILVEIYQTGTSPSDVGAGYHGAGTLTINGGGLVKSLYGYVGYESGSDGSATVSGEDSTWDIRGTVYVGRGGSGELNIRDGGLVDSDYNGYLGYESGAEGTARITGNNSRLDLGDSFYVGYAGSGTLDVQSGGFVYGRYGYIGYESDADGTAIVSGEGSTWMKIAIRVGYFGTGTLDIRDGGLVKGDHATLGYESGSEGILTVSGAGSKWETRGDITIGNKGTGTIIVQDGGSVENCHGLSPGYQYLGYKAGSKGSATVTGNGSTWDMDIATLYIGRWGTGTLTVQDGGLVKASIARLGHESNSEGTATVTGPGSTWHLRSELSVGLHGTATLNIEDGGLVTVGRDVWVNSESGILAFGIGPGGSGLLDAGGDVSLDGTFGVTLLDGYMPGRGDSFTLIEAAGITGLSYGEMMSSLPTLDGSLFWESDYVEGSSVLTVSVVPEPSTFGLLLIGSLAGLFHLRRRRNNR